jgi:hypothetical protein
VQRRLAAECLVELTGIHPRDVGGVERADSPLQLERAREGLLHGDLLIELEADEKRERFLRQERVGVVVSGEIQCPGTSRRHGPILPR